MHRVTNRTWIVMLFIMILTVGMVFFLFEYATESDQWVSFTGSPHVYNKSNLGYGTVYDREGNVLLDTTDSRAYSADAAVRRSTVHWLGDRQGNINAAALASYAGYMAGFDKLNGIYAYGGQQGRAELTLSATVQKAALEALGDRKGTVAVYNYKTGEILCAVTSPNYDPDNPPDISSDTSGKYEGLYLNRFLQSTYPPGSIFKLVTTAAALDSVPGILDMTFTCTGVYEYDIGKDVSCEKAHGTKDLKGALASSCNCCFAQITALVGKENMTKYVEQFGVVESVSFDGITTAEGNYDVSEAIPVELAWSGIGQYTNLINPCAYLRFVGSIAAGGAGAEPYLVKKITVGEETTYSAKTETSAYGLPSKIAKSLQEYMRNNVEAVYGAGNFPGLTVCGKSGTSQLGGGKTSNAMFTGFVADEQYPLAFICVVEEGGYGSATCVPILSRVLAACQAVLDGE